MPSELTLRDIDNLTRTHHDILIDKLAEVNKAIKDVDTHLLHVEERLEKLEKKL